MQDYVNTYNFKFYVYFIFNRLLNSVDYLSFKLCIIPILSFYILLFIFFLLEVLFHFYALL